MLDIRFKYTDLYAFIFLNFPLISFDLSSRHRPGRAIFSPFFEKYLEVCMLTTTETIEQIRASQRWVIIMSRAFFVDDAAKIIVLDKHNLEDSLKRLITWANANPSNIYLYDLTPKQRELCSAVLDNRFVEIDG